MEVQAAGALCYFSRAVQLEQAPGADMRRRRAGAFEGCLLAGGGRGS
jgi:hypothetical protein